jgi:hypothetical protein
VELVPELLTCFHDREVPSLELPVSTHYGRVFTTILGTDRDYRAMGSRLRTSLVDQPNMNRVRGCGSSTRVKPRRSKDVSLCLEKAGFRIHPAVQNCASRSRPRP